MRRCTVLAAVALLMLQVGSAQALSFNDISVGDAGVRLVFSNPTTNVSRFLVTGSTHGLTTISFDFAPAGVLTGTPNLVGTFRTGVINASAAGSSLGFVFTPAHSGGGDTQWNFEFDQAFSADPSSLTVGFREDWVGYNSSSVDSATVDLSPPTQVIPSTTPPPGPAVPEPNAALAFAAGFAVIGWASRRRGLR